MSNSNAKPAREKPAKPRPDFPMFAHPSGQWARKILGRLVYFGVWADPAAAEERHDKEYRYLIKGETPPLIDVRDGCSLEQLCDAFMKAKEVKIASGEFSQITWNNYQSLLKQLIKHFGFVTKVASLGPAHWAAYRKKLAEHSAPTTLKTKIAMIRAVFNWGVESKLHGPVEFGPDFERPSAKSLRKHLREGGARLFAREEILRILEETDAQMKAMVLLAVNTGFGNADIGYLEIDDLDLETGWVEFSRVKTEIFRRCPLWPETIQALREWLPRRPTAKEPENANRVFLTSHGEPFVRFREKDFQDVLSSRFSALLKRLKINGRRGLGFYALRHTHATIGDEAKDPKAVAATMGHIDGSVTGGYQHGVSDARLRAVTDTIRNWLFGSTPPAPGGESGEGGAL